MENKTKHILYQPLGVLLSIKMLTGLVFAGIIVSGIYLSGSVIKVIKNGGKCNEQKR